MEAVQLLHDSQSLNKCISLFDDMTVYCQVYQSHISNNIMSYSIMEKMTITSQSYCFMRPFVFFYLRHGLYFIGCYDIVIATWSITAVGVNAMAAPHHITFSNTTSTPFIDLCIYSLIHILVAYINQHVHQVYCPVMTRSTARFKTVRRTFVSITVLPVWAFPSEVRVS